MFGAGGNTDWLYYYIRSQIRDTTDASELALALAHVKLCGPRPAALQTRRRTFGEAHNPVGCSPQVDRLNHPVCGELEDQRHLG